MAEYTSNSILNGSPHTETRRDKTQDTKRGIYGKFITSMQSVMPTKSIKSAGKLIKKEGLMLFSEFLIVYPLYCGNMSVAKVSPSNTHGVDIWIQGSQTQGDNSVHRPDFQKNRSILAYHKKHSKTVVEYFR